MTEVDLQNTVTMCNEAASNLQAAFVWEKSIEGFDYWHRVYRRLRDKESAARNALQRIQEGSHEL